MLIRVFIVIVVSTVCMLDLVTDLRMDAVSDMIRGFCTEGAHTSYYGSI